MKKYSVIFALIATVFASCSKNELPGENPTDRIIKLDITVSNPNGDGTKAAIKSDWAANDLIQIWYDSNTQTDPDLVIRYDGSDWTVDGSATVSGNEPSASGTIKAVYSADVAVASIGDGYTYSNSTISFNLQTWTFLTEVQVVLKDIEEAATAYSLACDRFAPYTGFTVGANSITAVAGSLGTYVSGIANADGAAFVFASSNLWGTSGEYKFSLNSTAGEKRYTASTTINKPASQIKGLTIRLAKFTPAPVLSGVITVGPNPGDKVRFAPGNLQATYNAGSSSYFWGFAANQYDSVENAAGNTTIGTQGDGSVVDLFGWSTDAIYNNWGIHTITAKNSDYIHGSFQDWGTLVDGGSTWRTPTKSEWEYIINTRGTGNKFYRMGVTVCGKAHCLVIAPDGNTENIPESYDASAWATAESNGFVCLPPTGYRTGPTVGNPDTIYYWSSSSDSADGAYRFLYTTRLMVGSSDRYNGIAVRLVKAAE